MNTSDFHAFRKETARAFLQSAVLIDEEVSWERPAAPALDDVITSPGKGAHKIDVPPNAPGAIPVNKKHPLFASEVIEGFADEGIVCGVICPKTGTAWTERVFSACRKADIVILDWNLKISDSKTGKNETVDNPGLHAISIVTELAKTAIETSSLRLVAIYTGEEKANDDFLTAISAAITTLCQKHSIDIKKDLANAMLSAGPLTVVVTRKKIGNTIDGQFSEEDLPGHLITKFSEINSGLLKTAVISAIAAVRRKTFALINLFPEKMDAGYVAHRLCQEIPDDAEEHFVNIVISELHELLESVDASKALTVKNLIDWVTDLNIESPRQDDFMGVGFTKAAESLSMIFEAGIAAIPKDRPAEMNENFHTWAKKDRGKSKKLIDIAAIFGKEAEAETANHLWAERTSMRSHFEQPAPFIRPGTIISDKDEKYFLCIQQSCDCRRVKTEGRAFLFLPLKANGLKTDIVLQHKSQWLQFEIEKSAYEVIKTFFVPGRDSDVIRATDIESTWVFADKNNNQYSWVAALKPFHAQRIMHCFAEKISRVGVVESEWLRLVGK